jgi:phosphoglycolate phosphatase
MPALIVFDLDGTLVDSRLDLAESANELLSSYDAAPLAVADIVAMVGDGAAKLVARALRASNIQPPLDEALAAFLTIYDRRLLNHTTVYPGIETALASAAPRASMAVLTNKPAHHTRRLLDALGLSRWFAAGIIGGDTPIGRKPDPAGLVSLIRAAGAAAETTMMVGDSKVDIETAVRAGTTVGLARYGFGGAQASDVPPTTAVIVVERSDELGTCLEAFLSAAPRG